MFQKFWCFTDSETRVFVKHPMNSRTSFLRSSISEPATESDLHSLVTRALRDRLPRGWSVEEETPIALDGGLRPDLILRVSAPDDTSSRLVVEAKRSLDASRIRAASDRLDRYLRVLRDSGVDACAAIVAPYTSPAIRNLLTERGIGYVDATGNLRLGCDKPAFFIESKGADRDPWPRSSELRSLKGKATGAAIRALLDFVPPYGIRELADRAGVSAPTLSRVVGLLDREGLLERTPRGPVQSLDWEGTIRRWTVDYSVTETNRVATYLAPRGLEDLTTKVLETDLRYSLTGSMALPEAVSVAPPRLAMVYTRDVAGLASAVDLRPTDTGVNVLLLEPFDDVVFARTVNRRGIVGVACSQLAADLLTGPGRAPTEADELLAWMKDHKDAWQIRP